MSFECPNILTSCRIIKLLCLTLSKCILNEKTIFLALATLIFSSASVANEIGKLREMTRITESYKELSIDCLTEIIINKASGQESGECEKYKHFALNELQSFESEVTATLNTFTAYSKPGNVSKRKFKRGLKQLLIIQENMESIVSISTKIGNEAKK